MKQLLIVTYICILYDLRFITVAVHACIMLVYISSTKYKCSEDNYLYVKHGIVNNSNQISFQDKTK